MAIGAIAHLGLARAYTLEGGTAESEENGDPYLFVMRLTSISAGAQIAVLVNWSDHLETLGGQNTEITADYPRWLCQRIENDLGGTAIFFNGSIGKVSTLGTQVALPDPETGKIAQDHTCRKAELIERTVGSVITSTVGNGREGIGQRVFQVGARLAF